MERMVFNMEDQAADQFRTGAVVRHMTQGEYLVKLLELLEIARQRVATGDSALAVELQLLGLELVMA